MHLLMQAYTYVMFGQMMCKTFCMCIYIYLSIYIYLYMHVYGSVCVCAYIRIYICYGHLCTCLTEERARIAGRMFGLLS